MRRVLTIFPMLVVLFLIFSVLPVSLPAAAQDDNCPEGLVYYPEGEICSLPEEDMSDDMSEEPSDTTDEGDQTDTEDDLTDEGDDTSGEDLSDDGSDTADEDLSEDGSDTTDEGSEDVADDVMDDTGDMEVMEEEPVDEATGAIVNLTLTSHACPALWDPAVKGVDESLAGCTATPAADLGYTILYAGTEQVTVPAPAVIDLAGAGIPLMAGTWTIRENGGESDPYAACTITAADGSVRETIQQAVSGGSLDVELGDGEALDCEWFSTRELASLVGEGSGAIPSLTVTTRICPYGLGGREGRYLWTAEDLAVLCLAPGTVSYVLLYGETTVSSQTTLASEGLPVDMVKASAQLVTSGSYRLVANVPNPYVFTKSYCAITDIAGAIRYEMPGLRTDDTITPEIELDLKAGESVACTWYFMDPEVTPGSLLGIDITARVCPYNVPRQAPNETCSISVPEAVFIDHLRNDQEVGSGSFVLTPSTMSVTENGGPPTAGTWTFKARGMPADWLAPYWFCTGTMISPGSPDKEQKLDIVASQGPEGTYTVTIGPNQRLRCDVTFSKPVADDYIRLIPVECGPDPLTLTPLERASSCIYGVKSTFQILMNDQPVTPQGQGDEGEVMAPLTPGPATITTTPATGLSLHAVDCTITNSGQVQTIDVPIGQDGVSVSLEAKAGDDVTCTWFYHKAPPAALTAAVTEPEEVTEPVPTPTQTPETAALNDPPGTGETTGTTTTEPTSPQVPATGNTNGTSTGSTTTTTTQAPTGAADAGPPSSLEIRHWECPETISDQSPYGDLLIACTPSVDSSSWVIEGLEAGSLQITVGDEATSLVSCGSDGEGENDTFPAFLPVVNGAVTITIPPAAKVYCDWFVHP